MSARRRHENRNRTGGKTYVVNSEGKAFLVGVGFLTISLFLEWILTEDIERICSCEFKLHFRFICSIRIRSRNRDIVEKPKSNILNSAGVGTREYTIPTATRSGPSISGGETSSRTRRHVKRSNQWIHVHLQVNWTTRTGLSLFREFSS